MIKIKELILEQAKEYTIKEAIPYQIEENLLKEYECYQAYLAGANYALSKLIELAEKEADEYQNFFIQRVVLIKDLKKLTGM